MLTKVPRLVDLSDPRYRVVRATDLLPGDVALGSRQQVVSARRTGDTVALRLITKTGQERAASWRAYTTLRIFRPDYYDRD